MTCGRVMDLEHSAWFLVSGVVSLQTDWFGLLLKEYC